MATVYFVAGMPGAGKTTFAYYLRDKIGAPVFCKDGFKEKLFDEVGFRSAAEKQKIDNGSLACLYYAAENVLAAGRDVILESNFSKSSEAMWRELAERHNAKMMTIMMNGDFEFIFKRLCERDYDPNRHPAHALPDCYPPEDGEEVVIAEPLMDHTEFQTFVETEGFTRFALGPVVHGDTTDVSKLDYEAMCREIAEKLA